MRALATLLVVAGLAASGLAAAQPSSAPRGRADAALWAASQAEKAPALDLLRQLVSIDSQTGDLEGASAIHRLLIPRLQQLGAVSVEVAPSEAPAVADNLVAVFAGKGRTNILLIAHIDTVYPRGTVAQRPVRMDGERMIGPGVADEKGGVTVGIAALAVLKNLNRADYGRLTLLIDGSEETGSPGSTNLIKRLSRTHDVELNLEPGDAPDALTVWRKGSANVVIDVKGRAAHAGVAPGDGRNAAAELVNQLGKLNFPTSGPQETVNLTVLRAGERTNIIPDAAQATLNVRVRKAEDFDRIQGVIARNAASPSIAGTTVEVTRATSFPPLPDNPATLALAQRAARIYGELGKGIEFGGNGGASQSALASAEGTPALDGLGFVGGDFHTEKEWMDTSSVAPRIYLLARLIEDLSRTPPRKP
jgi:glutamate carboxypeptidase